MRPWELGQLTRHWRSYVDAAIALGLGVVGQAVLWSGVTDEGSLAITAPMYAAMSGALLLRRRKPLLMAAIIAVAWTAQAVLATTPTSLWALVLILVVSFSVGAHASLRSALVGGLLLVAAAYAGSWLNPGAPLGDRLFTAPVLCGGPWLAGRLVRRHAAQARSLDALNTELERRRAEDVRVATAQERARIARELHDVVAHSISVMVVQAGAAGQVLDHDPQRAKDPLEQIRQTGKSALVEMRRLVGVLRTDDEGLALSPQPGIADLPELVEQTRRAGLDTRLEITGTTVELAPGCDLAAYRIVQEALTNALKHAGRVPTTVHIAYANKHIEIDVVDAGTRRLAPERVTGHGLIGMRERASLFGGTVQAGPAPGGGWRVRAMLPVEGAVS